MRYRKYNPKVDAIRWAKETLAKMKEERVKRIIDMKANVVEKILLELLEEFEKSKDKNIVKSFSRRIVEEVL